MPWPPGQPAPPRARYAGRTMPRRHRSRNNHAGGGLQLRPGRSLKLDDELAGYPTAVSHFDALRFGPLTNLGGTRSAARILPSAALASPPGRATDLAPRRDVLCCGFPQRLRMSSAQVNLVVRAIQTKADSSFCLAAIDVIDEQGLYLLSHACSVLRGKTAG